MGVKAFISTLLGIKGRDGSTIASDANPVPTKLADLNGAALAANQQTDALTDAQLRASAVPTSGHPELEVIYPIDEAAHDLNAGAFSGTSNIADDFHLDYILLKFTTAEPRDITVTDADGSIVREVEADTSLSYNLSVDRPFMGADNFTLTISQTAGACSVDIKAVALKGSVTTPLSGVREADVNLKNVAISGFNELRSVQVTPIISLKSIYGLSNLRDIVLPQGSATVTSTDAEYRLQTTANGADAVTFSSAERGRYQSGTIGEAGLGVRRPIAPVGNQVIYWGYMDEDNGFFFGEDATGIFVARRRSGALVAASKVYQSSWNVDKLNGTGASGLTLDTPNGHIYRIVFTWYGYGEIEWQVVLGSPQKVVTVHREVVLGETSVPNPNLPIRAEVDNAGTATAFDLYVGGRQFSVIGEYEPNRRLTAEVQDSATVGASFVPIMSFRRKAELPTGVNNGVSVKFEGLGIITDNDVLWEIRQDATLVGASFGTPSRVTASETALEVDVAATSGSGGEFLNTGIAHGGVRNGSEFTEAQFFFDLIETQPVTLYMRRLGNQDATVRVVVKMREEW